MRFSVDSVFFILIMLVLSSGEQNEDVQVGTLYVICLLKGIDSSL